LLILAVVVVVLYRRKNSEKELYKNDDDELQSKTIAFEQQQQSSSEQSKQPSSEQSQQPPSAPPSPKMKQFYSSEQTVHSLSSENSNTSIKTSGSNSANSIKISESFNSSSSSSSNDIKVSLDAQKYIVKYKELKLKEKLGSGAFGEVWIGSYRNAIVAIKQINSKTDVNEKAKSDFINECEVMIKIKPHPNVIQMLAICVDPLCIVMEFAAKGSLESALKTRKNIELSLKIEWMKQIAAGMSHLHEEGVVHKDLAARNVLLTKSEVCKISDLGLSRVLNSETQQHTSSTEFGPVKWMAPESLLKALYSPKSDVWMFGVTCVEIITQK